MKLTWTSKALLELWSYIKVAGVCVIVTVFLAWLDDDVSWSDGDFTSELITVVLVGVGIGVLLRVLWRVLTSDLVVERPEWSALSKNRAVTRSVVSQLRLRSSRLKIISRLLLVGNAVLLMVGVFIFLYADQIVQSSERTAFVASMTPLAHEAIRLACPLPPQAAVTGNVAPNPSTADSPSNVCAHWLSILSDISNNPYRYRFPSITASSLDQSPELTNFDYAFESNLTPILQRNEAQIVGAEHVVSASTISTVTTRVGIVLMLLFLMQTLVALYRYNTRLASFYDGRADALQLLSELNGTSMEALMSFLSAERLDFGRMGTSPLTDAVELVKTFYQKEKS